MKYLVIGSILALVAAGQVAAAPPAAPPTPSASAPADPAKENVQLRAQLDRMGRLVVALQQQRDEWVRKALDGSATMATIVPLSQALNQQAIDKVNATEPPSK